MQAVPANRALLFLGIAALGCLSDLATKHWIFGWLGNPIGQRWPVWKNVVFFETSLNEGALFGIGQGMWLVFAGLSVFAALAILFWLFRAGAAREWLLTVALALVTAGILGNLYDRLGWHGLRWGTATNLHQAGDPVHAVRDWILVYIGRWPWPTFNLADSMLVSGAILLVWHAWRREDTASTEGGTVKDEGKGMKDEGPSVSTRRP